MTPSTRLRDTLFKHKPDNQTFHMPGRPDLPGSHTSPKQNLLSSLPPYLAIVGIYMLAMVILKAVELSAMGTDSPQWVRMLSAVRFGSMPWCTT